MDLDTSLLVLSLYVLILGIIVEAIYQKFKLLLYAEKRKEWDPRDELLPVLIGLVVVGLFYPNTFFGYLPFFPRSIYVDLFLTAVLVSRGANGAHEGYAKLGSFLESLIGRIYRGGV